MRCRGTYVHSDRGAGRATDGRTMTTDDPNTPDQQHRHESTTTPLIHRSTQERLDVWERTARQRKVAAERRHAFDVADAYVDRLVAIQAERDERANERYERDVDDGRDPDDASIVTTIPHDQQ